MGGYKVSLFGQKMKVVVDEELIKREIAKALEKRGLHNDFSLKIYPSLGPFAGMWIGRYNLWFVKTRPQLIIWLQFLPIYLYITLRKLLFQDSRPIHKIIEDRYNFVVGHELGHANDLELAGKWSSFKYLGPILLGGAIGALIGAKHSIGLASFLFLTGIYLTYFFSPVERKASHYSRKIFKHRPVKVSPKK